MSSENAVLIEQFLEMMVAARGVAKNSREAYQRDLQDFTYYLSHGERSKSTQAILGEGAHPHPAHNRSQTSPDGRGLIEATPADIQNWQAKLQAAEYSPRSIARKLSALRQFFRFLYEEEYRADNPTALVDSPKQPKSLPKMLSGAEIAQLLEHLAVETSPEGLRLRAMVELLYASGLRVSELVSLPAASANRLLKSGEPLLLVKGKGGKERVVPVHGQAQASLASYLAVRGVWIKAKGDEKYLFPSGSEQGYLTRQRFGQLLKAAALDAGLNPDRISPHVLRHSFASHLLAGGADLRVIQELLGHANLVTTEIYTHLQPEKLRGLVAKHPLAK